MVSVGKLSAGQARYYLDQAGNRSARQRADRGAEDYYLGGPEAAGRWLGRGARELGLAGRVGRAEFERVLPAGSRPRRCSCGGSGSVAGFDVTFSAPKSVSVLFGVGDAGRSGHPRGAPAGGARCVRILRAARCIGAARRRRPAERSPRNGLIAAAFLHRTSRAGDPHCTRTSSSRTSSADRRALVGARRSPGLRARAHGRIPLPGLAARGARPDARRRLDPVTKGSAESPAFPRGCCVRSRGGAPRSRPRWRCTAPPGATPRRSPRSTRAARRTGRPARGAGAGVARARRAPRPDRGPHRRLCRPGRDRPSAPTGSESAELAAPNGLTETVVVRPPRRLQALCAAAGRRRKVGEVLGVADSFLDSSSAVRFSALDAT